MITIVVAFDGSRTAKRALLAVIDLARACASTSNIHVAAVVDHAMPPGGLAKAPPDAPDLLEREAATALHAATEIGAAHGVNLSTHMLRGHVSTQIFALAKELDATLIAAGTHGRKGLARAFMGSTCERLVRDATIPVLTVRSEDPL